MEVKTDRICILCINKIVLKLWSQLCLFACFPTTLASTLRSPSRPGRPWTHKCTRWLISKKQIYVIHADSLLYLPPSILCQPSNWVYTKNLHWMDQGSHENPSHWYQWWYVIDTQMGLDAGRSSVIYNHVPHF